MSIKIKFNSAGVPEDVTLILTKKNTDKIGILDVHGIVLKDSFQDPCEITFTAYKEVCVIWEEIIDFRLVWCKDWDKWLEITNVETEEGEQTTKKVTCKEICQAELSQIMLYNIEINTKEDIEREDYTTPTVFYNPNIPEASLLHRITEKVTGYSFANIQDRLCNIQRTFKFDSISVYDALLQIAEEIECIFRFDSSTDSEGNIVRSISAYDLDQYCNACEYRGSFTTSCPECGSTNISNGYGNEIPILVSADELGNEIQFSADSDSVKNCFKLEAGDDLMTATIRNCNPNGSDYIWQISEIMQKDMSSGLKSALETYMNDYNEYYRSHTYLGSQHPPIVGQFNGLIRTYSPDDDRFPQIETIVGYSQVINAFYESIDFNYYMKSEMMPSSASQWIQMKTAHEEIELINNAYASGVRSVATNDIESMSESTATNIVVEDAKTIVDPRYKIEAVNPSYNSEDREWTGQLKVTSYSDDTETDTSTTLTIPISTSYETYLRRKVSKLVQENMVTSPGVTDLFGYTLDIYGHMQFNYADWNPDGSSSVSPFKKELDKYSFDELESFRKICQGCIDILIEQDTGNSWNQKEEYDYLYTPYKVRLNSIEYAIKARESHLKNIGDMTSYIQKYMIDTTHSTLDLQDRLGETLWNELLLYRREDKYSNSDYISDGLENTDLIKRAGEFLRKAKEELYKSAELQHTISTSLKNLLMIDKFQPILDSFSVGNWIRISVCGDIYRLRLLSYEVDFDNPENISVEFSDVFKTIDGYADQKSIIDKMTSMTTSFGSVKNKADLITDNKEIVDNWVNDGLSLTTMKIINEADEQYQTWDKNGMLFKKFDPDKQDYDPCQMKIINSTMAITKDNWKTASTAVGFFWYIDPFDPTKKKKIGYGINAETIIGNIILGNQLGIYTNDGSMQFNGDGLVVYNSDQTKSVKISPKDETIFSITSGEDTILGFNDEGNLEITGDITAHDLNFTDDAFKGHLLEVDNNGSVNPASVVIADKVRTTNWSSNTDFKIPMLSSNNTAEKNIGVVQGITYNPSTETLTVANIEGNADSANTATTAATAQTANVSKESEITRKSDNKNYPLALIVSDSPYSASNPKTNGAFGYGFYNSKYGVTYNPSTKVLTVDGGSGTVDATVTNAVNATNAASANGVDVQSLGSSNNYDLAMIATSSSPSSIGRNSNLKYNPGTKTITITGNNTSATYNDKGASNVKLTINTDDNNSDYMPIVCTDRLGGYSRETSTEVYDDLIVTDDIGIYKYSGKAILNLTNGAKIESDDTTNVAFVGKASKAGTADNADYVKFGVYSVGEYSIPLFYNTTSEYKQFGKDSDDSIKYNPSTKTLSIDGGNGTVDAAVTNAVNADYAVSAGSAGTANYANSATNVSVGTSTEDKDLKITFADASSGIAVGLKYDNNLKYNPVTNILTAGSFSGNATTATSAGVSTQVKATRKSDNANYPVALIGDTSPYSSTATTTDESIGYGFYNSTYGMTFNPQTGTLNINGGNGTVNGTVSHAADADSADSADRADEVGFSPVAAAQSSTNYFYPLAMSPKSTREISTDNFDENVGYNTKICYDPKNNKILSPNSSDTLIFEGDLNGNASSASTASSAASAGVSEQVEATRKSDNASYPVALINDSSPYSSTSATTEESIGYAYYNSTYGLKFNPQTGEFLVNGQTYHPITYSTSAPGSTLTTGTIWLQYEA